MFGNSCDMNKSLLKNYNINLEEMAPIDISTKPPLSTIFLATFEM